MMAMKETLAPQARLAQLGPREIVDQLETLAIQVIQAMMELLVPLGRPAHQDLLGQVEIGEMMVTLEPQVSINAHA